MANDLGSNVSSIVLKKFAPMFESDCVLMKTVDRQVIQGELNPNTGDTVYLKRPHQYQVIRTATGDISGNNGDLVSGKIAATVSDYATVKVDFLQIQEALELNQLDEILRPISGKLNTAIELELSNFILKNGALSLGTPGSPVKEWADVAQTGSMLHDLGCMGESYAVMNPWSAQNLAG
ncbi:unnamed protein product, partial [marine sediment metagenome]